MPTQTIAAKCRHAVTAIFVPAILGALLLPSADTPSIAHAKLQQTRTPGTREINISTKPDGYPISLDGKVITTANNIVLELPLGSHRVEITFPNDLRWTHEFNIEANDLGCIDVDLIYTQRVVGSTSSPTPTETPWIYIVAPDTVHAGDTLTFKAKLPDGLLNTQLSYEWKISPPEARILSGAGTPTIMVDTTGVASGPVTAALTVHAPQQNQFFAQTSTFVSTDGLSPSRPVELGTLVGGIGFCRNARVPVGEPSRRRRRRPHP